MLIELFLVALNFFSISIGIGFIITFEFFLGILSISSSFSPQEINLETVIISFGAGISQGYVPTLEEFYEALGVKKAFSKSSITDQSFVRFVKDLAEAPQQTTKKVRKVWEDVMSCDHQSTPSPHSSLKCNVC